MAGIYTRNGCAHIECGGVVVMSHAVPRDRGAERITMAHAQGSLEAIG